MAIAPVQGRFALRGIEVMAIDKGCHQAVLSYEIDGTIRLVAFVRKPRAERVSLSTDSFLVEEDDGVEVTTYARAMLDALRNAERVLGVG